MPPAAGLFSTITGWPSLSFSLSAIGRPITSMELPAGADITKLMGRSGHAWGAAGGDGGEGETAARKRIIVVNSGEVTRPRGRKQGIRAALFARAAGFRLRPTRRSAGRR